MLVLICELSLTGDGAGCGYCGFSPAIMSNAWTNSISLNNTGDALQVRCPGCGDDGEPAFYHGLSYGAAFTGALPTGSDLGAVHFAMQGGNTTFMYMGGDCGTLHDVSKWTVITPAPDLGTPPATAGKLDNAAWVMLKECAQPGCGVHEDVEVITAVENRSYRYGFNGQEKDDEVHGATGTSYDFGARIYDPRVGRWWGMDPLAHLMPWSSPYSYSFNNPIYYIDKGGMIPWPVKKWKNAGWNTKAGWFGEKRKTHSHNGVDLNSNLGGSSDLGAPVYSTHDGKVSQVKIYTDHKNGGGTMVYIEAPDGSFRTVYMHLNTAIVKAGDVIEEGQQIGTVGGTGFGKERGQAVHLHYEIHKKVDDKFQGIDPENGVRGGELIDPQLWIEKTPGEVAEKTREFGFNAVSIRATPEQGMFEKIWGAVKSALGFDKPIYDDSFFDTMDRYEKQKAERGTK